jgi:hypothetical protein
VPFTLPSRTPTGPRRRSLLTGAAGVGAALLAGCSAPDSSAESATKGSPSAADRARARAARDSERLAERYAAVLTVHPALAARLSPLRAEVVRHAEAFGGGKRASASPSPSAAPSTAASAPPSAAPSADVPVAEKDALAELAAAERELADRRTKALLEVPGELARLLASVAAAGAVHVFLLTEGEK